ncbi:hypothetical protein ACFKAU_004617, partial [Vibrio parahaemolyticus]
KNIIISNLRSELHKKQQDNLKSSDSSLDAESKKKDTEDFEKLLKAARVSISKNALVGMEPEFFGVWNEHHEDYKWQSLSNACAQQNVDVSDLTAHRALADCEMTRRLIHAVNSQIENQNNQNCDSVTKPSSEA